MKYIFNKYTLLSIPYLLILLLISYTITHAFFLSSANSNSNVFSAAAQFPTTPTPTPGQIAQTLVINEILPVSSCISGQTNGQFLELWNGSGAPVDLQQFKLSDGTNTIAIANSNTSLPNGAFAILVKSEGVINQCLGDVHGAVAVNLGGQIDLNTGLLKLLDSGNVVIDRIEFGASNSGILQTLPDQSIERIQVGFDTALGNTFVPTDFLVQCPPTPGTWTAPTGHCSPVISEVKITGGTSMTSNDFIELYNPTSTDINLTGVRLVKRSTSATTDTDIVIWTNSTVPHVIPAHKYLLWANSANGFSASASVSADFSTTDTLSTNDSIALRNGLKDTGIIIDAVAWGSGHIAPLIEGTAFASNPGANQSIERKAYITSTQATMEGGVDSTHGNQFDSQNNAADFILRNISQPQNSSSAIEIP